MLIAIHPTTYRRGGFLAHGVLNNSNLKNVLQQDNIQHLMKPMGQYVAKIYGFNLGKEDFDTTIKECEKKNEEINKGKEVLSKNNKSLEK